MPTNSYDLIVLGDDFAGLVAATLCAKRGLRVLVLSQGRPTGYRLGPHQLPVEPLPFCGMGTPAVHRVLDELGIVQALGRKLRKTSPSFQFVAPDIRLDVGDDDALLGTELARELTGQVSGRSGAAPASDEDDVSASATGTLSRASELARSFDDVLASPAEFPPSGFFKKREAGRTATRLAEDSEEWLEQVSDDPVLGAMVGVPALLSTHTGLETLTPEARARTFHLWRMGVPRVRGDWDTMREIFVDKLDQANGETRVARVEQLLFSWGKVNGVRLEGGEELGATHVIASMPVSDLAEVIGRKVPKRLAQCVDGIQVAGYRYTLNLVVDEAGIPEGMGSQVFLVSDVSGTPTADNAVAIHVGEPDDEARVVVTISAICPPPDDDQVLDDVLADLRVRLRERLELVMPFFSEHVLVAHAPQETAPPEGLKSSPGKGFPVTPTPVWRSSLDANFGVSAVPYSLGVKHLTVASSQVLPQLGIEGEFVTGWCAAKQVCDALGRKRDYLENEVIRGS